MFNVRSECCIGEEGIIDYDSGNLNINYKTDRYEKEIVIYINIKTSIYVFRCSETL